MSKRRRIVRYVAQTRLANARQPDTLPGEVQDVTGLSATDLQTLIDLGALTALADSVPLPSDEHNGDEIS
jgi:hypothetical protein